MKQNTALHNVNNDVNYLTQDIVLSQVQSQDSFTG